MRTHIEPDDTLLKEVKRFSGAGTKKEFIPMAWREVVAT